MLSLQDIEEIQPCPTRWLIAAWDHSVACSIQIDEQNQDIIKSTCKDLREVVSLLNCGSIASAKDKMTASLNQLKRIARDNIYTE